MLLRGLLRGVWYSDRVCCYCLVLNSAMLLRGWRRGRIFSSGNPSLPSYAAAFANTGTSSLSATPYLVLTYELSAIQNPVL
eukprot:202343-Rhodomonas_salina.1